MTALPYQPVPTIAQRRALAADHAKRHPVRQYRDNQDDAIAELQVARLVYVERAAGESCCGAEVDEPALTLCDVVRINVAGLAAITAMLAFGWLLREPMARALVWLGVL